MQKHKLLHTDYLGPAMDQDKLIEQFAKAQKSNKALRDSGLLVGTGLSGALALPLLAYKFKKNFIVVRKPDDKSTHSYQRLEGVYSEGDSWVFVDDFNSSGNTRRTVLDEVAKAGLIDVHYVGDYYYSYGRFDGLID